MQHLNLFSQLDREVEPLFSARQQLQLVAVVGVVMVVIAVFLAVGKSAIQSELDTISAEQKAVETQLKSLQTKKAGLEHNPALDSDIASLQREVKFRRRLLAAIDPEKKPLQQGFADHLSGLARQHIDGMWFTEIHLQQGGQQLALMGRTRAPEYVPRFLQKLSGEEAFAGHQFRVFKMSVAEEREGQLYFELRANEMDLPR